MGVVPRERSGLRPGLLQSVGGAAIRDTARRHFHAAEAATSGLTFILAGGAFDGSPQLGDC